MRLKQEAKRHPFIKEIMQIAQTWEKLTKTNKKYRRKKILDDALRRCNAFFAKSNDDANWTYANPDGLCFHIYSFVVQSFYINVMCDFKTAT